MKKHRVDFIILDESIIPIQNDTLGAYFMIEDIRANVPPHCASKHHFFGDSFLSIIIDDLNDIGIGILSAYLYDLIKNKKIKHLKVNGNNVCDLLKIKGAFNKNHDNR